MYALSIGYYSYADIVLNDKFLSSNSNAYGQYNFDSCFSSIKSKIDGDLVIFNLEGLVDVNKNGTEIGGAPIYNYPKEIVSAARSAGFNVCITANDRASYFSDEGIKNNIENIREAGFFTAGTSLDGEKNYYLSEFNGIKIAVLAYTDKLINVDKLDVDRIATLDFRDVEGTMDLIDKDIKEVKEKGAEIIVASMHWGEEMASTVTDDQRELASRMIESGVDIIYGTKSHVFQPVTYKNVVDNTGTSKNVLVAYSMGNFLSQPTVTGGQKTQQSAILNIYVERDTSGKAYVSSAECVPIYTYAKALDSVGSDFSYSILPASEYALSETKPDVFLNDTDWINCKTAYEDMKKIVENSSANGIPLGLK
jgi:poly-gamma-glutamate synthesis protein (capsule biosynthesis protein)